MLSCIGVTRLNAQNSTTPQFSHQYRTLNQATWHFVDTNFNHLGADYYTWDFVSTDPFGYARLGNLGMARNPLRYQQQSHPNIQYGFLGLQSQSQSDSSLRFYYVRSPLTEAKYRMGYGRGQVFSIAHTQNINKHWNALIGYTRLNSNGLYNRSGAEGTRFMATSNYLNPENGFRVTSYFQQERLTLDQNGGLQNDSLFEQNVFTDRVLIDVNLASASREHRKRVFYNDVSFDFLKWNKQRKPADTSEVDSATDVAAQVDRDYLRFGHKIKLGHYKQVYDDDGATTFYANNFFSDAAYRDSNAFLQIENTLYLEGNVGSSSNLNVLGGIRHSYQQYSQEDFALYGNNYAAVASIGGSIKEVFQVHGKLDYTFLGPLRESVLLEGGLRVKLFNTIGLHGSYSANLSYPDIKTQFYRSNHFIWQNNFKKVSENVLRVGIDWGKSGGLEIRNILLKNYVYFDANAQPQQYDPLFAILEFSLKQDFTLWRFLHLDNKIVYQINGEKEGVLPLPDLVTRNALYFQFSVFKRKLKCLVGAELNYFSAFNSPSYMPATGAFYLADRYVVGNYPRINAFANFQLKSARLYLKYEHINQGLNGYTYYAAPSHPFPDRILLIGIDWRFFN
jgi:hypothetical protein